MRSKVPFESSQFYVIYAKEKQKQKTTEKERKTIMENERKLLLNFRAPVIAAKNKYKRKTTHTYTHTLTHMQHKSLKSMEKYFAIRER